MKRIISLVLVLALGMATEVASADFTFGTPNPVLDAYTIGNEWASSISADGLSLFFTANNRAGGYGHFDIWVMKRKTVNDPFGAPLNLGPTVNTSAMESDPSISSDGLSLYFSDGLWDVQSPRPGGFGGGDLWVTTSSAPDTDWDSELQEIHVCLHGSVLRA